MRLYAWRARRDLTLQEVARLSGVSMTAVSRAELGQRDLRLRHLTPIVERAFGIDLHRFFGRIPTVRRRHSKGGRPRTVSAPLPKVAEAAPRPTSGGRTFSLPQKALG